jgi:hypothetical protein
MDKNLLILRAHKDVCGNEIGIIETQGKFLNIGVFSEDLEDESSVFKIVEKHRELGRCFDFIYVCSHGNQNGFEINMDGKDRFFSWASFGQAICESSILNDDTVFMIACCKGGVFSVATDIMAMCDKIFSVCGIKSKAKPLDIATGFVVILYNLLFRKIDLINACRKASNATDMEFVSYYRDEIEYNSQFYNRQSELFKEVGWVDEEDQIVVQDSDVFSNSTLASWRPLAK